MGVHPRACGERIQRAATVLGLIGSSPRLRGTHRTQADSQQFQRFIPAPAGNAVSACVHSRQSTVHPRACGERPLSVARGLMICGSSPRLRGTPNCYPFPMVPTRFIPAPAGNAAMNTISDKPVTVHPRACGERTIRTEDEGTHTGSSPRLRGTLFLVHKPNIRYRFIPAPAGNARFRRRMKESIPVHPRACGERAMPCAFSLYSTGSSPRLRGTPCERLLALAGRRFIPAPAGNARDVSMISYPRTVHPRACGERGGDKYLLYKHTGSSPRLRGTLAGAAAGRVGRRFIPAPAGNAKYRRKPVVVEAVHPRACGERRTLAHWASQNYGSSPRLRGTRRSSIPPQCEGRFIPAPAGNAPPKCKGMIWSAVHPRACGERSWP